MVLDGEVEDEELLVRWLSEKRGKTVRLLVPQRGDQAQLVQMCRKNAAESIARQTGGSGRDASALDELRRLLGLEKPLPISRAMTSPTWPAGKMWRAWWCLKTAAP